MLLAVACAAAIAAVAPAAVEHGHSTRLVPFL